MQTFHVEFDSPDTHASLNVEADSEFAALARFVGSVLPEIVGVSAEAIDCGPGSDRLLRVQHVDPADDCHVHEPYEVPLGDLLCFMWLMRLPIPEPIGFHGPPRTEHPYGLSSLSAGGDQAPEDQAITPMPSQSASMSSEAGLQEE